MPGVGLRQAAVLVPLQRAGESLSVILTRRSHELSEHAGQVAFPGGRIEATDTSPETAALREAREELGLEERCVSIVGRLDQMATITGFHVTPVVGEVAPGAVLRPDAAEVARVFSLPIDAAGASGAWRQREHRYMGSSVWAWHLDHDGEDIWGVTALILRGMSEILRNC